MKSFLRRLRNLTLEKVMRHFVNFIYKRASLFVVVKKLDTIPRWPEPKLNVECRLLNTDYIQQISNLSNLDRKKIKGFFKNGSKCLAAFHNGQLIAYVWCHYHDYYFPFFAYCLDVHQTAYIGPNFVSPEFRGNRLHRFLLTKLLAILQEEGYQNIWSSVLDNNYPSIKGLMQVGFKPQQNVEVIRVFKTIAYKNTTEIDQWYTSRVPKTAPAKWQKARNQ